MIVRSFLAPDIGACRAGRAAFLAVALLTLSACSENGAQKAGQEQQAAKEKIDKLRALPYVDFTPDPADTSLNGTIFFDAARSYPGYSFYTVRDMCIAELIDADGTLIQRWDAPKGRLVRSVLLENGDVLMVGKDRVRYAMRMDWNGNVIWRKNIESHHDIALMDDGRYVLLTVDIRHIPQINEEIETIDHGVTILSADGKEIIGTRSLTTTLLEGGFDVAPVPQGPNGRLDLIHANSVRWMTQPHLFDRDRIYQAGNMMVSMRHQDLVAIFAWESGELLWTWGPGEVSGQHDAQVLHDGNILLFDNGLGRDWSRVIELDPLQKKIVWQYGDASNTDFYTNGRGACQRLPNGNTLITESEDGRVFEVTHEGELVWEYYVPYTNHKGGRATLIRCYRHDTAFVERILAEN